jgi:radical SAM protein with 4Fe4S-binding SPASM domain
MPDEFPSFLMVQTTTRCNAACIFCPYPVVSKEIPRREMSFTLFRKLMNECSRHPRLGGIMLYLMNEPLTDPQLVDRIDYAKQRNPETPIIICTNGCNLDRVTVDGLLGSGLDHVTVSIHAQWPATYRRLTGRADFVELQRRVTRFVQQRNQRRRDMRVEIRLIGAQQFLSADEVSEAERYWRGVGADDVEVFLGHTNRAGNLAGTYHIVHRRICGCRDGMPFHMAAIVSNGDVVLCCMDWRREVVLGNVNEHSLQAIWSSPRRREVLAWIRGERDSAADFLCKRCMESEPA